MAWLASTLRHPPIATNEQVMPGRMHSVQLTRFVASMQYFLALPWEFFINICNADKVTIFFFNIMHRTMLKNDTTEFCHRTLAGWCHGRLFHTALVIASEFDYCFEHNCTTALAFHQPILIFKPGTSRNAMKHKNIRGEVVLDLILWKLQNFIWQKESDILRPKYRAGWVGSQV